MSRNRPPLNSLVAFEAAARHGSFTRAADELNVTQGAVSRHVGRLEHFVGYKLFQRANRQVLLTDRGAEYARSIKRAIGIIDSATEKLVEDSARRQITLVASTAVASLWLLPRIASFKAQHGDAEIRILARDSHDSLATLDFDLAVFYAPTNPRNMLATKLFEEEVFCVCSPGFRQRHYDQSNPLAILRSTLLSCDLPGEWVQWSDWFAHFDIENRAGQSRLEINNHAMVLQAAADGQGIALAWKGLVDDYLASGGLVRVSPHSMKTGNYFYLLEQESLARRPAELALFREWLIGVET